MKSNEPTSKPLPSTLTHQYLQVESRHRLVALAAFLRKGIIDAQQRLDDAKEQAIKSGLSEEEYFPKNDQTGFKAIVFFSTCASVEFHHLLFSHAFWPDRQQVDADNQGFDQFIAYLNQFFFVCFFYLFICAFYVLHQ